MRDLNNKKYALAQLGAQPKIQTANLFFYYHEFTKALNSFSYLFFYVLPLVRFYDGNYFIEVNKIKSNKIITSFNGI